VIARLVGTLVARDANRAIVDVNDVGYAVHGPLRDVEAWAHAEEPVEIWVHTDVREDAITLYGFSTDTDRVTFERLRAVNGVGPKIALAVLDAVGLEGLARAVASSDTAALTQVSGIGKKLAQRLVLELQGKLPVGFDPDVAAAAATGRPARGHRDDQLDLALARLGYTRTEIVRAHRALEDEGIAAEAPVADRLRVALRILSGG
jgi:Holliday junction DNA helicase RuvA